jgi:hypothetical protein
MPNRIIGRDGRTIKEAGSVLPEVVLDRILALSYEFMAYPDSVGDLAQSYYGRLIEAGEYAEQGADAPRSPGSTAIE